MALRVEAAVLLVFAVALAGPVPAALARARWTLRSPRAALVLWQAVGLAGGLSILGAGVTLAAASLSSRWLDGITAFPTHWSQLGPLGWAGTLLTLTVGLWLVIVAAASAARVVLARRAHRNRLDAVAELLDRPLDGVAVGPSAPYLLAGVHLLDHPAAVAYCLPGLRPRIVVSRGVLQTLGTDELAAVVAHERAHAEGHHDLVIQPFIAWKQTFPFLPAAGTALAAVDLLVEMLADDTARRHCALGHLQAALAQLAQAGHDRHHPDHQISARLARLANPLPPLPRAVRVAIYLAAIALVLLPPAVLLLS